VFAGLVRVDLTRHLLRAGQMRALVDCVSIITIYVAPCCDQIGRIDDATQYVFALQKVRRKACGNRVSISVWNQPSEYFTHLCERNLRRLL